MRFLQRVVRGLGCVSQAEHELQGYGRPEKAFGIEEGGRGRVRDNRARPLWLKGMEGSL